jgi:hypothetical protein
MATVTDDRQETASLIGSGRLANSRRNLQQQAAPSRAAFGFKWFASPQNRRNRSLAEMVGWAEISKGETHNAQYQAISVGRGRVRSSRGCTSFGNAGQQSVAGSPK